MKLRLLTLLCLYAALALPMHAAETSPAPVARVFQTPTGPQVQLAWDANPAADLVNGYNVWRSLVTGGCAPGAPPANCSKMNTASLVAGTTFNDSTVQNGKTYFYVVTAFRSSDSAESLPSNEVKAIVPLKPPSPPTNLHIVQILTALWSGFKAVALSFFSLFR